ncbi:MAG: YHYH domain-containing protein [Phycisphaeraceae bacterium]|nr:YHYH domain-containing protein [Phycisphaeraceae bacterium]
MRRILGSTVIVAVILAVPLILYGHSGGLDSNGGHYNRKTGEYHVHRPTTPAVTPTPTQTTTRSTTQLVKPNTTPALQAIRITENHWQVAINNKYFRGQLEVSVATGRADIATDTEIVEVDKSDNYLQGIEQALRYAEATGKKPVLVLYIDGDVNGLINFQAAQKLCDEKVVRLVLANCYVSANDLIQTAYGQPIASSGPLSITPTADATLTHWLNTSSGTRHNQGCRWFRNTQGGRMCRPDEGRPCSTCGG